MRFMLIWFGNSLFKFSSSILLARCKLGLVDGAGKKPFHLNSLLKRFKDFLFMKWRLAFLAFVLVYAFLLVWNLGYSAIRWDEVIHYFGGLQLLRGNFLEYLTTNTFYPPMFNLGTAVYFGIGGISLFTGRLVAVTFSLLSLFVLFELTNRMFGGKVALLSAVFFGVMPGVFWVSRMAYIETMLEFFFLGSMLCFFFWLQTNRNRFLVLAGFALALGFLAKYQALVAGIVMLFSIAISGRAFIRWRLSRFLILILVVAAVAWGLAGYCLSDLCSRDVESLDLCISNRRPAKGAV